MRWQRNLVTIFVFAGRTFGLFFLPPHRACPGLTHPQGLSIRGRCWQFSPDHGNARSRYSNAAPADVRLFEWREQSQMERPLRASFTKGNRSACVSELSATAKSQNTLRRGRWKHVTVIHACGDWRFTMFFKKKKTLASFWPLNNFLVKIVVSEICH